MLLNINLIQNFIKTIKKMNTQIISLQFFTTLLQSDFLTKTIMLILLIFSIVSWTIIIEKFFKFKFLNIKTSKFEKTFWSGEMLEDIYHRVKENISCPSVIIFISAMQEWTTAATQSIVKSTDAIKKNSLKDRLYDIMFVAANRSMGKLKSGINFLLISSTTSTFFGLLGTVWGINQSFKSISMMKDASLMAIAPGVSAALLTTIMGLISAIPALISYYVIIHNINRYEEELNNFLLEILSVLSRELDK